MDRDAVWNFLMSRTTINDMMGSVVFRLMVAFIAFISLTMIAVLWNGYPIWNLVPASASLFCFLFAVVVVFCFTLLPVFWQIILIVYAVNLVAGGVIAPVWLLIVPSGIEASLLFGRLAKWMEAKGILKRKNLATKER